ncbi:EamA-like transporter family protein [Primorskyibacter sedentarius]|uniref:EamA-like transporter family protein n=1 Tax=Primorskyibacter sedentarius TaxID=745311 RepID=A0A4R3JPF3_9RHOB|nr:EamA family transporter [Primorskyibacter sedentarius]TCS67544.1 EamA-like transporter family protein [Primorskyibacter sedentarius]
MSLTVFFAVLAAALLHAGWNALIKLGASKMTSMLILTLVQAGMGGIIAMAYPLPSGEIWLWLLASGVFHSGYKLFLAYAYEQGDLSRVYPIARGAAPLIVTLVSGLLLADIILALEYFAIAILGLGILLMAHGVFQNGESRRLVPLALGSALMTAGYSLVDGLGARAAGNAAMYVAWLFIFDGLFFTPICLALRGRTVLTARRPDWVLGSLAAAGSYAAYAIVVWAMTQAPIALVTALRETSILFALLLGWLFMGDRIDRTKALAAALIVLGVVLTRL